MGWETRFRWVVVAVSLLAAACTGETTEVADDEAEGESAELVAVADTSSDTSTTLETTSTTKPIEDIALAYFEDLAESRESISAEPDSPAYYYTLYRDEMDFDVGIDSTEVTVDDTTATVSWMHDDGTSVTFHMDDIEMSSEGVRDFILDGAPLSESMAVTAKPVFAQGMTAEHAISYLTVTDAHIISLTIANNNDAALESAEASFVNADGLQIESTLALGAPNVGPGVTETLAFEFASEESPAGTLYVDGYLNDDDATPVSFVVEIPS